MEPAVERTTAAPAAPAAWRRTTALAACAYLLVAGAVLAAWLVLTGRASASAAGIVCLLPLALAIVLGFRPEPDDRQFIARLLACVLFGPVLTGFWAGSQEAPGGAAAWPAMLAGAALHAVAFVAVILWLGGLVTRVPAAHGVTPVDAATLVARLMSVPATGAPLVLGEREPDGSLEFLYRFADGARSHRVLLALQPDRRRVRVFERLGAEGARPANETEASMRAATEPSFDPTRPRAHAVSGTTWQTTLIDVRRFEAMRVAFTADRVAVLAPPAATLDPEAAVTLLAAVVSGSGWTWQPGWRR